MSKKRKKIIIIFTFIFITLLTFVLFGIIDYNRFMNDNTPIFIVKKNCLDDGGTTEYIGVGYQLINWKFIDDEVSTIQYKVGKEVHFFCFIDLLEDEPSVELKILKEKNLDTEELK